MKRLVFLGTLHAHLTPEKELIEVLESINPRRLFVEIVDSDLKNNTVPKYPPEMRAALNWARMNKILARGFDAGISRFNPKKTKADNDKAISEAEKIIKKFNWKDFNKPQYLKKLFTKSYYELVDLRQWKNREAQLANYILSRSKKLRLFSMIILLRISLREKYDFHKASRTSLLDQHFFSHRGQRLYD